MASEALKREPEKATVRLQATVTGWPAWAIEQLAIARGQSTAEVGSSIVSEWVDQNFDYLKKFGITFEEFRVAEAERVRRVVRMSESKGNRTNE
jgi:hypothetical protein